MRNGPPSQYTCTERVRTVFHGGPILTEHLFIATLQADSLPRPYGFHNVNLITLRLENEKWRRVTKMADSVALLRRNRAGTKAEVCFHADSMCLIEVFTYFRML